MIRILTLSFLLLFNLGEVLSITCYKKISSNAHSISPKRLVKQIKQGDLVSFQKSLQSDSTLLNHRFKDSSNLLMVALKHNKTEIAKYLIEKGIEVNIETKKHITPLLISTRLRQYDITKLLVKNGASINVEADYGETPLRNSMQLFEPDSKDDVELFKFLISNGADVKHICERCCSSSYLITAISSYKNEMAIYLLDIGVDSLEHKSCRGFTALHLAISFDNLELVMYLLKKGANINSKTSQGLTVFELARRYNAGEVMLYLENNYCDK
ncbi:MAG: hypothetical protein CFE21_11655 [Bacteroidetes bacterium B1(2017)]|nr:MAG: hypothetical protein CFE21_11655 [Bacteroidetes bacterium B1(2017)]